MRVRTCTRTMCARATNCVISVAQSVQDMSGTLTAISLGTLACGLSVLNWFRSGPVALPEPIAVEVPAASPAEFACSCSCPTPAASTIAVVAPQSGLSWAAYGLLLSLGLWCLSLWCFCRWRTQSTVVYEAPVFSYGGARPLALDDDTESAADRRAIHVRGLRRGGGALA